ncbi:MAG: phenylalanine--tRNA ligase subunit beta [Planctomycetota bacterium]
MHVSFNWLGRHVDLTGVDARELALKLTMTTCEVEGVEPFAPHLAAVTVGHVVERAPHPDADKLSVCQVDVGAGAPIQIVCGAPNVRTGLLVAVATTGTTLPGDLKIKKSKIRGAESNGMICSVRELGLGDDHDGIWELPGALEVGRPVAEALGLADWVIEIDNKSLTHRPDLWGHRGIAREVAALLGRPLKTLDLTLPPLGTGPAPKLRIEDPACSRYIGLALDGFVNGPSPSWLRHLLLAVGQRPIDLLVDLSNFVMLDLGQPNHAFDRAKLGADGIVVRKARAGERMTTLDGEARALEPSDLLITSGGAPVALAGIMGGEGSKVEAGTSSLLLEVATFAPAVVRRTSSRLGLRTDSSARFEKHLDPTLPLAAAGHYANLLRALQPAVTFPLALGDVGDWSDPAHTLTLRGEVVRRDLGADLDDARIAAILTALGFGVRTVAGVMHVDVPAARATKDVTMERDLVEEVGRAFGYGNVPEAPMRAPVEPPPHDASWHRRALARRIEDRLAGAARFRQTLSYSFQSDSLLAAVGAGDAPHVRVANPVAPELTRIRRDVAPSLLALLPAARRERESVRLFEIGKGYRPEVANEPAAPTERGEPREVHQVALVLARAPRTGARFDEDVFFQLRAVVDDVVAALGLEAAAWSAVSDGAPAWAHPAKRLTAAIGDASDVALLAALDPGVARALGLDGELATEVAVAVLSIDALLAAPERARRFTPLAKFPGVKVDVAIVAPEAVPSATLSAAIEQAGKGAVAGTELFDVYRGESLGAGQKSLAWHILLRSGAKTLDEGDVQKFLGRLERLLAESGATLRR